MLQGPIQTLPRDRRYPATDVCNDVQREAAHIQEKDAGLRTSAPRLARARAMERQPTGAGRATRIRR